MRFTGCNPLTKQKAWHIITKLKISTCLIIYLQKKNIKDEPDFSPALSSQRTEKQINFSSTSSEITNLNAKEAFAECSAAEENKLAVDVKWKIPPLKIL